MFKRIAKYTGVFVIILLMFPVILVKSGFDKFIKLFLKDDQSIRNRAVDKFAESLSNNEARADAIFSSCSSCGGSCGCSSA
ncbi:hypothetical protein A3I27_00365 [Candidatus Giovannonibacteria bacterium RIFCSPLOWO2_02_FULL_43_11b]|uniref:Uncharacterized protein n=1 Tax=Candidatus Nomurabacteria bacterium RIFCSPLOWO2_12_FULL_46_14 TaxID=1801797 RepID=A0A1F6Y9N7_9BACT|nr:MAG: hypothetical protein A2739_02060 [Candidatus Giovannonibacteria bacterium RIFCSPHIGHO2_01_FULL_43_100]OGF90414.1 MAG: hypothetical protein A3I27_00365 [Candidatus Giovannonibacteria bacterium RIFCSPLOWO2_02_FULL_43_11b]OGJ03078.1 MAG: hypothetical protein A3G06_02250 [Candidatus Nomurabacteria bacterium RIFCSPLOWO2_12_FULL_46_14]